MLPGLSPHVLSILRRSALPLFTPVTAFRPDQYGVALLAMFAIALLYALVHACSPHPYPGPYILDPPDAGADVIRYVERDAEQDAGPDAPATDANDAISDDAAR